jgi:hypothetical protein
MQKLSPEQQIFTDYVRACWHAQILAGRVASSIRELRKSGEPGKVQSEFDRVLDQIIGMKPIILSAARQIPTCPIRMAEALDNVDECLEQCLKQWRSLDHILDCDNRNGLEDDQDDLQEWIKADATARDRLIKALRPLDAILASLGVTEIRAYHEDGSIHPTGVVLRDGLEQSSGNQPAISAEGTQAEGNDADKGDGKATRTQETWVFTRSGDGYFVSVPKGKGYFAGLKGFGQILQLILAPDGTVPMRLLVSDADVPLAFRDLRSRQPTIDSKGFEQIRAYRQELQVDLAKATKDNDLPAKERIQAELQKLNETVVASMGLGNTPRDLNNELDKLRPRIHASLRRAYETLRKGEPPLNDLADHFERSIFSENGCFVYRPSSRPCWRHGLPEKL